MATAQEELLDSIVRQSGYPLGLKAEVLSMRDAEASWQSIAYWLKAVTGRAITAETLRRWYSTTKEQT